jgi:hypothetical protein
VITRARIAAVILGGMLILTATTAESCDSSSKPTAQKQGQAQTEQAYKQQAAAVPYPADQLKDSLERRNIRERLLRTNKPNAIGYVYVMSFGKIIGYYTIKGKVSSTQSQMTTDQFDIDEGNYSHLAVNAPGDDGSYGANEPGVFFFTTEGAMVETNLDYIVADQPLPIDVPLLNKR